MKNIVTATLISTALFASSAFAADLSSFGPASVEANLATGVSSTTTGFQVTANPLSQLGNSVEGHLSATAEATSSTLSAATVHAGLEAPANSSEALL